MSFVCDMCQVKLFFHSLFYLLVSCKMTTCIENCKWTCIIAYYVAAVAAIFVALKTFAPKQATYEPSKIVATIFLIGGLITFYCGIRWAMQKPQQKSL